MTDGKRPENPRWIWAGVALVLLLGGLLVADKIWDGWDGRQWLIAGGIILWALGPSVAGGLVGAYLLSRSLYRSPRTVQAGPVGLALGMAFLAATVTAVILQPDTKAQFRPMAGRLAFASDRGLLFGIQAFAGSFLGGYCARHAASLHSRRRDKQ